MDPSRDSATVDTSYSHGNVDSCGGRHPDSAAAFALRRGSVHIDSTRGATAARGAFACPFFTAPGSRYSTHACTRVGAPFTKSASATEEPFEGDCRPRARQPILSPSRPSQREE